MNSPSACQSSLRGDQVVVVTPGESYSFGEFSVRRTLPDRRRKMVGPFIFFDQMGPAEFITDGGIDVRPHPHIGLATISYLFRGRMHHRDSLGTDAWIEPGAVNWMVAGRGITHSERTDDETQTDPMPFFGIQTWVALPKDHEDRAAAFEHAPAESLPVLEAEGKRPRLILGTGWGERAPVQTAAFLKVRIWSLTCKR